jgi:hypothetical protein
MQNYITPNEPAFPIFDDPATVNVNLGLPVRLELASRFLAAYLGGDHFDKAGDPAEAIDNALWWADKLVFAFNEGNKLSRG